MVRGHPHPWSQRYHVWIGRRGAWEPQGPADVPPKVAVVELAEPEAFSAAQARRYVESFNRVVFQEHPGEIWAVALPVVVRYQGDPLPGAIVKPARLRAR